MNATSDADDRDLSDADGTPPTGEPARSVPAGQTGQAGQAPAARDDRPRVITTDPTLDEHQRQGVTGATWIALILGALILIMLLIFILQNNVPAGFAYLGWAFDLPLGVAMLFAAIAGVLVAALFGSIRLIKLSRRVRRLEKERESIKQALR